VPGFSRNQSEAFTAEASIDSGPLGVVCTLHIALRKVVWESIKEDPSYIKGKKQNVNHARGEVDNTLWETEVRVALPQSGSTLQAPQCIIGSTITGKATSCRKARHQRKEDKTKHVTYCRCTNGEPVYWCVFPWKTERRRSMHCCEELLTGRKTRRHRSSIALICDWFFSCG